MPQVKVYGRAGQLQPVAQHIYDIIDSAFVDVLDARTGLSPHRFLELAESSFIAPSRGECYLIIEISMFPRKTEVKRQLIRELSARLASELDLEPVDIEIIIYEVEPSSWGMRGKPADHRPPG